jgi:cellulose synthase/poly-beta-1,6-N-acetylglucosamine synthase-like glycosyltransferase
MATSVRIVIPSRGANPGLEALLGDLEREMQGPSASHANVIIADQWGSAAANRNHGAEGAPEDWLLFIDDDVRLPDGWLALLKQAIDDPDAPDLLGGTVGSVRPRNWYSQAAEDFVIRHKQYPQGWYLVSAHLAIRTRAFTELGGFDESFATAGGEDWDLCSRAHRAGMTVGVRESIVCHHTNPTSWAELAARARAYGRGSVRTDGVTSSQTGENTTEPLAPETDPARQRTLPSRAIRWVAIEYAELRHRGRGRTRAARSTALYIPWMATYLRAQDRAAGILDKH